MESLDFKCLETDWTKYIGFPYKHLGLEPKTGIDCFNLIKYVFLKEFGIDFSYSTRDLCNIIDENWYYKTHEAFFTEDNILSRGWEKTEILEPFNAVTMVMGTSNITNHCALYIGNNRIIHTLQNHKSHIAVYGNYYKQYTVGKYKWTGLRT